MIYMSSTSDNSGNYIELTITFDMGTDPDMALVKVQNRVQQATPMLPTEVTTQGVTVESRFSDTLGFVGIISPHGTKDGPFLMDYAENNIKNVLNAFPHGIARYLVPNTAYGWIPEDSFTQQASMTLPMRKKPEQTGVDNWLHRYSSGKK